MDLQKKHIRKAGILLLIVGILYALVSALNKNIMPPRDFPVPYQITIDNGQSLFSISEELYDDKAISSRRVFEMLMMSFGSDKKISHGEYYFDKPMSVIEVAMRISGRDFGINLTRVTFPEGFTNKQISLRLGKELHNFDETLFLELVKNDEGYLFPDTYTFFPWSTPEEIVKTFRANFDKKILPLKEDISISKHSLKDIIIMASIIEKEANGEDDRAIISGILWNRIDAGIALQVDAPFLYIIGKESKDLTKSDLAMKSPYNTYINKGLPPGPISNPGLASINAALNPEKTNYFYYLHDSSGKIYYAKTFTEHKRNIQKYLK